MQTSLRQITHLPLRSSTYTLNQSIRTYSVLSDASPFASNTNKKTMSSTSGAPSDAKVNASGLSPEESRKLARRQPEESEKSILSSIRDVS
jgi:hypothetical protein